MAELKASVHSMEGLPAGLRNRWPWNSNKVPPQTSHTALMTSKVKIYCLHVISVSGLIRQNLKTILSKGWRQSKGLFSFLYTFAIYAPHGIANNAGIENSMRLSIDSYTILETQN